MKLTSFSLCAVLFGLQYQLWLGKNGLTTYYHLSHQVKQRRLDNASLTERNRLLYAEVNDLKDGIDAIESLARTELGWIRYGETFYRILPSRNSTYASDWQQQDE